MPKCALILSEDGISSFDENDIDHNINYNISYFEKNTISQLNPTDFDMVLFVGNNTSTASMSWRLLELTRLTHTADMSAVPVWIGLAGTCSNIWSVKSEFIDVRYIDDIKYTIDATNSVIQCESSDTHSVEILYNLVAENKNNNMYNFIIKDYKKWSDIEEYSLIDAVNIPNNYLVTINNTQYFISQVLDSLNSFDSHIDEYDECDEFWYHLKTKNVNMSDNQIRHIYESFIAQHFDIGIYDILLTNLNENLIYIVQIRKKDLAHDIAKSEFGDGEDYFVVDCCPFSRTISMYLLNYNVIPSNNDYYNKIIKPNVLNFCSPLLCKVVKKYRQQIEDVINKKTFFECYI